VRVLDKVPEGNAAWDGNNPDAGTSKAPYRLYNIGNNNPVRLMHMIEVLERNLGKTATKNYLPMQAGDVQATYADVDDLMRDVGFKPSTSIEEGLAAFTGWYQTFYPPKA
jgi:UDP-glucuronate 4-epimerase